MKDLFHESASEIFQYRGNQRSAKEQEKYAEQSYELTAEQFNVGMKNTVELVTAQNNLLNARVQLLQSKYTALMNNALLDIYQGNHKINEYEN